MKHKKKGNQKRETQGFPPKQGETQGFLLKPLPFDGLGWVSGGLGLWVYGSIGLWSVGWGE